MMKTKLQLLLASSALFIATIANAQTWSHGSNEIRTGTSSTANGSLLFYNSANSNTVAVQSGATSTTYTLTLPTSDGSNGNVLQTNGSGTLSWANSGSANVYETSVSISSGTITNLVGNPVTIVSAPGSGKYIEVISASVYLTFSDAYDAGENNFNLKCSGAAQDQANINGILQATSSGGFMFGRSGSSNGNNQLIDNAPLVLEFQSDDGNPTGGTSTLKIKVMYRIVTI